MNVSSLFVSVRFISFFLHAEELPYLKCPLHTVLKLTPVAYGERGLLLAYTDLHIHLFLMMEDG